MWFGCWMGPCVAPNGEFSNTMLSYAKGKGGGGKGKEKGKGRGKRM